MGTVRGTSVDGGGSGSTEERARRVVWVKVRGTGAHRRRRRRHSSSFVVIHPFVIATDVFEIEMRAERTTD